MDDDHWQAWLNSNPHIMNLWLDSKLNMFKTINRHYWMGVKRYDHKHWMPVNKRFHSTFIVHESNLLLKNLHI